ncbi:hypothetical protein NHQ30_003035 [Ciborinia camelliae]|nr:hypothetical protein NHQ30_003035 [Ciborinia camelliae]
MGTLSKATEVIQVGCKAYGKAQEAHRKYQEIDAKVQEVHRKYQEIDGKVQEARVKYQEFDGRAREAHKIFQDVQQQVQNPSIPLDRPSIPRDRADFKEGAKGYARGCLSVFWTMFKAEAKKYITYVLSLLLFTFIAIGLICFLIPALWHHPHLQLLTLTTKALMPDTKGGRKSNSTDEESVSYRIYLLHYCVSGLTAIAEKQFDMKNGCHESKQALYNHILPALSTTFTPPLPGKGVPGPITDIQTLFKHYGYISFGLYIFDIILLPIVAGGFIWWFISTYMPWKRTFRGVLCFFTATLFIPAVFQTILVYSTIYILEHHIDLTTSNLNITIKPGSVYLFIVHLFWVALLFNITVFFLIDCVRNKRRTRKLRLEAQNNQGFNGRVHVGPDGIQDTFTQNYETGNSSPRDEGIEMKNANGDLGDGYLRRGHDYENQRHGKLRMENEGFSNV